MILMVDADPRAVGHERSVGADVAGITAAFDVVLPVLLLFLLLLLLLLLLWLWLLNFAGCGDDAVKKKMMMMMKMVMVMLATTQLPSLLRHACSHHTLHCHS